MTFHSGTRCAAVALAVLAALAALAVTPDRAVAADQDPRFHIAKAQLLPRLNVIGVEPTIVRGDVADAETAAARVDQEVAEWLALAGYTVVPATAMRPIEERARAALGGLYDPMTGQLDAERAAAFREFVRAEYALGHPVDALVRATVVQRQVRLVNGRADWDGVSENATGESTLVGLIIGAGDDGDAPALSLDVTLIDAGGQLAYASAGGLQLLSYVRRSKLRPEFEHGRLDPKFIMTDPLRERRAVAIALDALTRTPDSPARAKYAKTPQPIPAEGPAEPSAKELAARHAKIALAAVDLAGFSADPSVGRRLGEALKRKLEQAGLSITPVDDVGHLWSEEQARVHGFFDRQTGALDGGKLRSSRARLLETLQQRSAVTALVLPVIERRLAPFRDGYATWDGAREMVGEGLMSLSIFGSARFRGRLEALSLSVRIFDQSGDQLYEGFGGLQLAVKLDRANRIPVPPASLLTDAAHDTRAIDVALQWLVPPKPPARD
jgi:hypothetical protein